jgi:hypothetical protein
MKKQHGCGQIQGRATGELPIALSCQEPYPMIVSSALDTLVLRTAILRSNVTLEPPYTEPYVWWRERSATLLTSGIIFDKITNP